MTSINKLTPTLRKAPQPPLSHAGAVADADRAKGPPLDQPNTPPDWELNPGDRVEGLASFGKPTGEFGTVEQTNVPGGIQPADMIAGNGQCRGFMVAVAVLIVLLTLLLFSAWSRKRNNPKPEPPLHTAALGSKNSDVDLTCTKPPLLATDA